MRRNNCPSFAIQERHSGSQLGMVARVHILVEGNTALFLFATNHVEIAIAVPINYVRNRGPQRIERFAARIDSLWRSESRWITTQAAIECDASYSVTGQNIRVTIIVPINKG